MTDVACYACGAKYAFPRKRCDCGEPLWFREAPVDPAGDRLARYAASLPVDPSPGLGSAVGGTPRVRADRLDDAAGCRVSVKVETANPTGSFKDRGSAVGAAWAREQGRPIGTVSHGNMARSTAAHAAALGLECVVLVPADIPDGRLPPIAQFGPELLRVEGDYGRLYAETLALDTPVAFVNSDTPLRVAGQKTVAYEICEDGAPDAVVLPVSSGGQASAIWKGLRELRAAGRIEDLPRLHLVQAAACDPIAAAYREGRAVEPADPGGTIAYSIANADPPSGDRALAAVRATGGAVTSVDDDAIRAARSRLARAAGIGVEPSSAVALAGLERLSADGEADRDEAVTLIATGAGGPAATATDARTVGIGDLAAELAA